MSYIVQESDKRLIKQHVLNLRIKIDVYDKDENYIDTIKCGLISGSCNIDAGSDIRRTASFVLIPQKKVNTLIEENSLIWINRNIVLSIGIQRHRKEFVIEDNDYFYLEKVTMMNDADNPSALRYYEAKSDGRFQLTKDTAPQFEYKAWGDSPTIFYTKNASPSVGDIAYVEDGEKIVRSKHKVSEIVGNSIKVNNAYYERNNVYDAYGKEYFIKDDGYIWYQQGKYLIQTYDSTYDATTNQLTINCADWTSKLDGTKNGQLGALITSFPAYKEYYEGAEDNYYFEDVSYMANTFSVELEDYGSYKKGDYMVLKIPTTNHGEDRFKINDLPSIEIVDLLTSQRIKPEVMKGGYIYSLLITSDSTAALTNQIPLEDIYDGVPLNYYIIRDGVITALERLGDIHEYNIDDIGEYQAMPQYNPDYLEYREDNPLWNNIPYDLEFSVGDTVQSILTSFRDLYPNYEFFFDENGTYVARMIPSSKDDDIYLDNSFLQEVLISENFSIDTTTVRNVTEVFGASLDTDYTAESCVLTNNIYTIEVPEYGDTYYTGDLVAIAFDVTNPAYSKIQIHTTYTDPDHGEVTTTLEPLVLLDQMTDKPLEEGTIEAGALYVCKIKTRVENGYPVKYFYFLSQYQPQAINVLTDGSVSKEDYECADGTIVKKYSLEYFKDFYNCRIVSFTVDINSAFTIQKLGVLLNVYSGGEFDNIESDQRALARAEWENWKTSRLTDTITITTKILPWLDVNKKVSFRRSDKKTTEDYIIQSVAHDPAGGTSSITMYKFRPLYMEEETGGYTYDELSERTYDALSVYTYGFLGGAS